MDPVHKITSLDATWQPGDVVLDADSHLWVRSTHHRYVWGYPDSGGLKDASGRLDPPDGGVEDSAVKRPLVLIVRDGEAVGGRLVDE